MKESGAEGGRDGREEVTKREGEGERERQRQRQAHRVGGTEREKESQRLRTIDKEHPREN